MTKVEKVERALNDRFREVLAAAMKEKFDIDVKTEYDFLADRVVTTRVDKKRFTKEQHTFMESYEKGYLGASHIVSCMA